MADEPKRTFVKALSQYGVPQEPLQVYTSNSYRRIGLTSTYREIVYACRQQSDGHLDIAGTATLEALVAAFNWALTERAQAGEITDTQRLEWLTEGPGNIASVDCDDEDGWMVYRCGICLSGPKTHASWREAIDAAMGRAPA